MNKKNIKIIAHYLPQFHPIPENDIWWGKGFTEWTNVGRAKPLFKGHYQPRIPADLGYYDLRIPEIREEQTRLAKEAGIYGFCYWHYWFGNGKQLLEMPINEVIATKKPNFPFCFGWANESWKAKIWNANDTSKDKVLIEQKYLGKYDNELHFKTLLSAFRDERYIRVDNKPFFLIYKPELFLDIGNFIEQWNVLIKKYNIADSFYFVAHTQSFKSYKNLIEAGFNSITVNPMSRLINSIELSKNDTNIIVYRILKLFKRKKLKVVDYKKALKYFINVKEDSLDDVIPTILPNWDHSPRSGGKGVILHGSSPNLFMKNIELALSCVEFKPSDRRIILLKSWNEWAEGNYVEPDIRFGKGYLDVIKTLINHE